jgi:tetratricopeptide (TPR) repeat protein
MAADVNERPQVVAANLGIAVEKAVAQCPAAEEALAYLAHCAPAPVPMTLFEGVLDNEERRRQAISALAEASLVQADSFDDGTPAVTVPPLIYAAARGRSLARGMAADANRAVIARLNEVYPWHTSSNKNSGPLCAQLTPHLFPSLLAGHHLGSMDVVADLLNRGGVYLSECEEYEGAALLLLEALAIYEVLRPEHADTSWTLNKLAGVFVDLGDLAAAGPLYERVLVITEKALGPEHTDTARALDNFGMILLGQRDMAGARSKFERAVAICETAFGPEHRHTAECLHNLGCALQAEGELSAGRQAIERAITVSEQILGPDHPDLASKLCILATVFRKQGDREGARRHYERALAICEKALGAEHHDTRRVLRDLANLAVPA